LAAFCAPIKKTFVEIESAIKFIDPVANLYRQRSVHPEQGSDPRQPAATGKVVSS
jgi:hypothetical protein